METSLDKWHVWALNIGKSHTKGQHPHQKTQHHGDGFHDEEVSARLGQEGQAGMAVLRDRVGQQDAKGDSAIQKHSDENEVGT